MEPTDHLQNTTESPQQEAVSVVVFSPVLPDHEYRSRVEEEKDKMQVQLSQEQTASAELQARLEAEKDGNY